MSDLPKIVEIIEVGPRDGLQIEPQILSTSEKLRMIDALTDAGLNEIEAGSIVNPKAVPQMADTDELFKNLNRREGVRYRAFWLNPKGFERHKGAAGDICTEGLAFACGEMGIETGIDLDALVEAAKLAEELVGHPLPGKVMKGGTLTRYKESRA